MNTMKSTRALGLLIGMMASVCACADGGIHWHYDGRVIVGGKQIKTNLDSASVALITEKGIFLGGYLIDQEGINYPEAVYLSKDLSEHLHWPISQSIQQFFQFQDQTYLLTEDGLTMLWKSPGWKPASLRFPKDSTVIWAQDDIIACNPRPLLMADPGRGRCGSYLQKWQVEINWRRVEPKVCGGKLVAIETRNGVEQALQIDLKNGATLTTKKLASKTNNVCALTF